jgi:hydrogenase-4 component B
MAIFAALGLSYGWSGTFALGGMGTLPETLKVIVFLLAFLGFGSKAGVFPVHVWLPHAHPAAPSHISALMSGVMIKTGIYGILRVYTLLELHSTLVGGLVLVFGAASGILGVVYAMGQRDIKRLLAYSSVENIGIILIGMGIGMIGASTGNPLMAVLGFSGSLLHVLNHAIFKSLLFMGAGMVLHATGSRTIDAMGGLLRRMKVTGTTVIIGSLAICGLPPFNGFVSEFLIYIGAFKGIVLSKTVFGMAAIAIVSLAVIGGLALACFTQVVGVMFQGEPRSRAARDAHEKGPAMLVPMSVLAFLCILVGVLPGFFIDMALKAVSCLGLEWGQVPLDPFCRMTANITRSALVLALVLALVAALRSLCYRNKPIHRSGTWGCGFSRPTARMQYTGSSYASFILSFFSTAAPLEEDHPGITGRFPAKTHYRSRVHDIAEKHMDRIITRPLLALFDRLRWIQHGDIHLYIGYILLAIVLLLLFI